MSACVEREEEPCCLHDLHAKDLHAPGSVCCFCGDIYAPASDGPHGEYAPTDHEEAKDATIADLKARLKAIRAAGIRGEYNSLHDAFENLLGRATDLRVKKWSTP